MTLVVPEGIELALESFGLSDSDDASDALCTTLGSLGVEISIRARTRSAGAESEQTQRHWLSLARSCDYMTKRLGDLLARLVQVRWIHAKRVAAGERADGWLTRFSEMAVKDFHGDAASLMDSLAPIVAQVPGPLPEPVLACPPGFSDIVGYSNSKRKDGLREAVPAAVLALIDATERWWPPVKKVRQFLHHREHHTISFGHPEQGFLFQVYSRRHAPLITDPVLMWPDGVNVGDFEMYSAFVVAEVVALLNELGTEIGLQLGVQLDHHMLTIGGEYAEVVSSLSALRERARGVHSEHA